MSQHHAAPRRVQVDEQPPSRRSAIYARVSDPRQEKAGTSLETQEAACRAEAAKQGLLIDDAYVYREVHTGVELWERPQLTALREAVRRRAVDVVIVHAIDRLSRDPVHLGVILTDVEHAGAKVVFVTEPLDTTPEGQLIRFVRGYAAKVEHEKIKERVARGRLGRVQAGKLLAGRKALFGYQWDAEKTRYLVNEAEAELVRQIFTWAATGVSCRQIALRLTKAGIPTPTGRPYWTQAGVRHILTNPAYIGAPEAYRLARKYPLPVVPYPEGTVPAIIDPATFHAIQELLPRYKVEATRNNHNPEDTLLRGGYIVCGHCGRNLAVQRNDGTPYYICCRDRYEPGVCRRHAIVAHTIDDAVMAHLLEKLSNPAVIQEEIARQQEEGENTQADITSLDRAIAAVTRKQIALARRVADLEEDDAAGPPLLMELRSLAAQKQQLEEDRERALARQKQWKTTQARLLSLAEWCDRVVKNLTEFDYAKRRLALHALNVKVRLWRIGSPDRWEITSELPMQPEIVKSSGCQTTRPGWPARARRASGPA